MKPTRLGRQSAYLRSLQFGGINTRFLAAKGSGAIHRRAQFAYYAVPAFVLTGLAISNLVSSSFGVYLKHQALTDTFHKHSLMKRAQDLF